MGSRRTNDERTAQLRAAGVSDDDIARISAPIGLDIGARTPEETAISIAAELVALRWGGSGQRLRRDGRTDPPPEDRLVSVAGLVLAAGAGTRFGRPKALRRARTGGASSILPSTRCARAAPIRCSSWWARSRSGTSTRSW